MVLPAPDGPISADSVPGVKEQLMSAKICLGDCRQHPRRTWTVWHTALQVSCTRGMASSLGNAVSSSSGTTAMELVVVGGSIYVHMVALTVLRRRSGVWPPRGGSLKTA